MCQDASLAQQGSNLTANVARPFSLVEQLDLQIASAIRELSLLQEKKKMLMENPGLEDQIQKFNKH